MYVIFWRPSMKENYFFSPQSLTRRNKHMKRVKGKGKEPLGTSLQLGIQSTLSKTDTFGTGTKCPS